jgi:hypothetical protein
MLWRSPDGGDAVATVHQRSSKRLAEEQFFNVKQHDCGGAVEWSRKAEPRRHSNILTVRDGGVADPNVRGRQ